MTVELREYTNDELRAIPPLMVGYCHLRNPFHHVTGDPLGTKLANRWAWIRWPDDMAREHGLNANGEVDSFVAMEHALAVKRSGFHRADGDRGFALFPAVPNFQAGSEAQRRLEADWESRCLAMHEAQTPITLAEKPVTNYADYVKLRRGD